MPTTAAADSPLKDLEAGGEAMAQAAAAAADPGSDEKEAVMEAGFVRHRVEPVLSDSDHERFGEPNTYDDSDDSDSGDSDSGDSDSGDNSDAEEPKSKESKAKPKAKKPRIKAKSYAKGKAKGKGKRAGAGAKRKRAYTGKSRLARP